MSTVIATELTVEPILQYPRLAKVGTAFLLTVDLKPLQYGDTWAYPDIEEVPVRFIINSGTLFRVEFLGEPVAIVHRYGGTYSPARFLLTPEPNSLGKSGKVRITLANRFGMPIAVLETDEIAVKQEVSADSLIALATGKVSPPPIDWLTDEFDIVTISLTVAEELEQKVVPSERESIVDEYVTPSTIRSAIARIFNANGEVVGGGFLVAGRSQNYILTFTDVANQAMADTTDFDFPITTTEPQNKVARSRGEIHLDFLEIATEQKLKAKVVFWSPVYQALTEPVGFAVLQVEEQLPLGVQAIELLSPHDMQNHHARIFNFSPVGLSVSSGMLGSKNKDGLVQIEALITDPIFSGTPVWDENLEGVVGMTVNLGLTQNINDVFMIPADVLVKAWDKLNRPNKRHLLFQQGNTRIYSLCTDAPWNLPFDAFIIPVGVAVSLTGSLASALRKHVGETNSLQLEAEIQRILEQKHQTLIAPEDPLIVPLSSEINSLLNPVESDQEHFLICATVESPEPSIENAAKAVEGAIVLSLERKLKRIVITLLGTGVNCLPVDGVTKAMLTKLDQVLSELPSNSIEEIIFVDKNENFIEIVNQVAKALEGYYNNISSSTIPNLSELLPYEPDALSVLEFIERRNSEGHDTPEEEVTKFLNKPKGDDGIYYLLENLRILGFLAITKAGEGVGTVRYDLAPQYLETRFPQPLPTPQGQEFASRQEHLYNAQKKLLTLIVKRSRQQKDTTQLDTKSLFDRSKENLTRYRRLEHLRLLGFIRKKDAGTGMETSKYNLTLAYQDHLKKLRF